MLENPLGNIQSPTAILQKIGLSPDLPILKIVFFIVFAIWAIYTLIVVYHWIKYSHASLISFPAILVHLIVSALFMSYALSGIILPSI